MSIIVASVGEKIDDLFLAVREFPTEKIILISCPHRKEETKKSVFDLEKFKIPVEVVEAHENVWEDTFRIVHSIKRANEGKDILINVSTGDTISRCAMTSAAFVNGLKAFSVTNNAISMLPVLKFSYYSLITDRKMKILKALHENPDCCASMEELSKKCEMSLPLVSYHINGNSKSEGLREMALVETNERGGKTSVDLSLMGRILMNGYVDREEPKKK
jgi:DNA-binding transcriptional ArsR family regulator